MRIRFVSLLFVLIFLSVGCEKKPIIKQQPEEEKPKVVKEAKSTRFRLAPDFMLKDLNRDTFILSSYKDKQPVLLFFWTTWCPSCRSELKTLNDLYPELIKEGWELFAIDVAESAYRVENFVKNYALNFKVLLDKDAAVMDSYDLFGVPTYVLVDKEGYIVFKDNYFPRQDYRRLILG